MPTMDTGRGAEPGLLATDWASLEFVTWWKTDDSRCGENSLADAGDLLVGDAATWSDSAAPGRRQRG